MENFPKKDIELKNRIRRNTYDILEITYEANATTDIDYKKQNSMADKVTEMTFGMVVL